MTGNLERDAELGAWLARIEAPDPVSEARALARVRAAISREGVRPLVTWRGATAGWSRTVVPLAAAAGLLGALLLSRLGEPEVQTAQSEAQDAGFLDVIRRNDAENYLVSVAVTNYRNDWATGLVGSTQ